MLISLAIVITAAIGMAGCATTGMERSTEAKISMTEMNSNIKLLLVQLDATGASLRELVKTEIQKYLSNYLTPKGIKAIEPLAREVAGKGSGLKYEIKDIQAAVNRANAKIRKKAKAR